MKLPEKDLWQLRYLTLEANIAADRVNTLAASLLKKFKAPSGHAVDLATGEIRPQGQ